MATLVRRLIESLKAARAATDLGEEIETHRLMTEQRLRESGMTPADAAAESRRIMGNTTLAREDARAEWLAPWLESVGKDLVYALRHLRSHPAFTLTAGLTLVLVTTLNTSVFTVFSATVLRPWPVRDPDRVVMLHAQTVEDRGRSEFLLSDFEYFRQHARTFTGLTAFGSGGARVGTAPGPDFHFVRAGYATAGFHELLGVAMATGRGFLPEEDSAKSPQRVVVIGAGLWQRAFGSDPQILGRTIYVNDDPMTIVGVTAPGIEGNRPFNNELWMPMATAMSIRRRTIIIAGRLQPGIAPDTAAAELAVLMRQLDQAAKRKARMVTVTGTRPFEQPDAARQVVPFTFMLAALFVVLLLACANVGNLQLARALARRRELAIRLSLGAARGRVVRQLLTETLLLAGTAGVVALSLSFVVPTAVLRATDGSPPMALTPDLAVLLFAVIICGATTIAAGLAPALRGTRDAAEFMNAQRGAIATRRPVLRAVLLGTQVALSATLIFAATLLTRGLLHAANSDPGYQLDGITVVTTTLPPGAYDATRSAAFVSELKDALSASGVGRIGFVEPLPLQPSALVIRVRRPQDAPDDVKTVHHRPISAGAFDVLGIPLAAGRLYNELENRGEVVVNEAFARTFWPGEAAVGQQLVTDRSTVYTVVGVVRDVQFTGLGPVEPVLHHARLVAQVPPLLVRSQAGDVGAQLRAIVQRLEPRATVVVTPLADVAWQFLRSSHTSVAISWMIGCLALVLAIVGVFGVFSCIVEERSREIGIRMALGARRGQVLALVFAATRTSVIAGLGAAVVLSAVSGFVLRWFLFGLSPLDPLAYAAAGGLLAVAAMLATAIPVRRATRVDPAIVLRLD